MIKISLRLAGEGPQRSDHGVRSLNGPIESGPPTAVVLKCRTSAFAPYRPEAAIPLSAQEQSFITPIRTRRLGQI